MDKHDLYCGKLWELAWWTVRDIRRIVLDDAIKAPIWYTNNAKIMVNNIEE